MVAMRSLSLAVLVSSCLVVSGCGDEPAPPAGSTAAQQPDRADLQRARAAAFFNHGQDEKLTEAWAAMESLVARPDALVDDLVRGAIIDLHDFKSDGARGRALVAQALQQSPEHLSARWISGNFALRAYELEQAVDDFGFVVATDPDDCAARLQLAEAMDALGDMEGAMDQYRAVRERGLGPNGPFYAEATYKLQAALYRRAKTDEERALSAAMRDEHTQLRAAGIESARDSQLWIGRHGDLLPPPRVAAASGTPGSAPMPSFDAWRPLAGDAQSSVLVDDVDGDGQADVLLSGPEGVQLLSGGSGPALLLASGAVQRLIAGDLDDGDPQSPQRDPDLELLLVSDGRARLLERDATGWAERTLLESGVHDGLFADLDHDGGLDIVLATDQGLRWFSNHGPDENGVRTLRDATPAAFAVGPVLSVFSEDFDGNQAVDLLAVGPAGLTLLSGLWGGTFGNVTQGWGLSELGPSPASAGLLIGDLDNDGVPDLLLAGATGLTGLRGTGKGFAASQPVALDAALSLVNLLSDLNADGTLDLLGLDGQGAPVAFAGPLLGRTRALPARPLSTNVAGVAALALADLDGDGNRDLLLAGPAGATVHAGGAPSGNTLRIVLEGRKDNARGVGAIVELLAGGRYSRAYARGATLHLGLGDAREAEVVSVLWPNGVSQRELGVTSDQLRLEQQEGLTGSCPFLYTWNGETFTFVTDVLGTTPLGLPMAPGVMVPFDHDEYVAISGSQLVARDGKLDLVLTEELREVTYLDQVRLHAIDHPADVEVQPNEAFTMPPFLPHLIHTLADLRTPAAVITQDGQDVTELVASRDGRHARAFTHRPPRFRGLTEPWSLELRLAETTEQRAALANASRVRLVLTAWLLWPDASVNLSAARHPQVSFEPPMLSVPQGDGWMPAGAPIGFVAGKTKTMVLDITELVSAEDPRLLLSSTLALSWDRIALSLDGDDVELRETVLPPSAASLAFRGFSARLPDPSGELGERFDWDQLESPRWDQHEGRYTRYGPVLPLLTNVDDRYVIFGAGDAVTLQFDAAALPELQPGMSRTWLLYLDGWAKDRDPNTVACQSTLPLPFHAMSSYPPAEGEVFPASEDERLWDAQWNTRAGARLVPRLAARASRSEPGGQ